jgi:hypothetical protein
LTWQIQNTTTRTPKPFSLGLFQWLCVCFFFVQIRILKIRFFSLPIGVLLSNITDPLAKTFEPCSDRFRSIRQSSFTQINEQQLDNGDGYHHTEHIKSTLCV